jgi:hypothetical protein
MALHHPASLLVLAHIQIGVSQPLGPAFTSYGHPRSILMMHRLALQERRVHGAIGTMRLQSACVLAFGGGVGITVERKYSVVYYCVLNLQVTLLNSRS